MTLRPITRTENKTSHIFASENCQQLLAMYDEFYPKIGYNPPWIGYFVIKDDSVVGSCGFVGKPNRGKVELAYWTFAKFEGQGIASFACRELIAIARKADPGVQITAKTVPAHNASTKILQKNNFIFTEIVQDEEIGDAWLWILEAAKS